VEDVKNPMRDNEGHISQNLAKNSMEMDVSISNDQIMSNSSFKLIFG